MEKIDFAKTHKELYGGRQKVTEVVADKGAFLYVDGQGQPGGDAYVNAIGRLFPVVYTLKFAHKAAGDFDFAVSKIETLWYDEPEKVPMNQWRWRVLIRVPENLTKAEVEKTKKQIEKDKGTDVSAVGLISFKEGRCLQIMHVGPYSQMHDTYAKLHAHAAESGLALNGPAHEIYISDPRRTAPERLKTIVRLPVKKAPSAL